MYVEKVTPWLSLLFNSTSSQCENPKPCNATDLLRHLNKIPRLFTTSKAYRDHCQVTEREKVVVIGLTTPKTNISSSTEIAFVRQTSAPSSFTFKNASISQFLTSFVVCSVQTMRLHWLHNKS